MRRRWGASELILSPCRRNVDDKIQLKAQFNTEGGAAAVQDEVPRQGKNLAAGMLFVQR